VGDEGDSRAISFPKMVKIARAKQIKIESDRTIKAKNFCAFHPKYFIFLCGFASLREIILLTNLKQQRTHVNASLNDKNR
jgi:hypothetical protein